MTRSGSQRSGQTSFVQAGYDDEEGGFTLVSSLRWLAFDLALLQQSRSIEILLTGGDQVDALVVIGINDEVAIVLSEALSAWGSVSAGFPIGDSPTLEVPRTAYLYDGGTRTEALATWYTAGRELAFRFDLPERDILIDVGFAQSRIYVSLEPADAFSNGVDAVTLISVGEDFDWIEGGSGFFFADLRSVDPLAMIAFLDWTSAIELLLKYADGTWARIVVTKGPSFGQLLDAAAATWTAAVAVDPSPLPGAPPKTPNVAGADGDFGVVAYYRGWVVVRYERGCYISTRSIESAPLREANAYFIVDMDPGLPSPWLSFEGTLDDEYYVAVYIDNGQFFRFDLFSESPVTARLSWRSEVGAILDGMRQGLEMQVAGANQIYTFSLLGFTAAFNRATSNCN